MFLTKTKKKASFLHQGLPCAANNSLSRAFKPTQQPARHRQCQRWWGLPGWQGLVWKVSRNLVCSPAWHRPKISSFCMRPRVAAYLRQRNSLHRERLDMKNLLCLPPLPESVVHLLNNPMLHFQSGFIQLFHPLNHTLLPPIITHLSCCTGLQNVIRSALNLLPEFHFTSPLTASGNLF